MSSDFFVNLAIKTSHIVSIFNFAKKFLSLPVHAEFKFALSILQNNSVTAIWLHFKIILSEFQKSS